MAENIIIGDNAYTANSFFELVPRALDRLVRAGLIRHATEADVDLLCSRTRVGMSSGACWGDGNYVANQGANLYNVESGFSLNDVDVAHQRMRERARAEHRADVLDRIDATD